MADILEGRITLLSAATTGTGTAYQMGGLGREHTFYIVPNSGTFVAGAVILETAPATDTTGTWAPLAGATTLVSATLAIVSYTGCLLAIRARLSTAVTGTGTVSVYYVSN